VLDDLAATLHRCSSNDDTKIQRCNRFNQNHFGTKAFPHFQVPLTIEDLQVFANDHAVRVGDILETLFLMAIYGEWRYTDAEGNDQKLDEEALNSLYAKGRLTGEDLKAFSGLWHPTAS